MDSDFLEDYYSIKNTVVIRNIPKYRKPTEFIDLRKELGIEEGKILLLYQGVMLDGRGIQLTMNAIKDMPQAVFILAGHGEKFDEFKELSKDLGISDRVYFLGNKSQEELINYTAAADIGLALIENISVSYYHALPNKLFEYIMAEVPVLCSNLPQMKQIVEHYKVGESVDPEENKNLIEAIEIMVNDSEKLNRYKKNCREASKELNWGVEYSKAKKKLFP
jgi:glycosyltransferase involved in cell wall biosynthesis